MFYTHYTMLRYGQEFIRRMYLFYSCLKTHFLNVLNRNRMNPNLVGTGWLFSSRKDSFSDVVFFQSH